MRFVLSNVVADMRQAQYEDHNRDDYRAFGFEEIRDQAEQTFEWIAEDVGQFICSQTRIVDRVKVCGNLEHWFGRRQKEAKPCMLAQ